MLIAFVECLAAMAVRQLASKVDSTKLDLQVSEYSQSLVPIYIYDRSAFSMRPVAMTDVPRDRINLSYQNK